MDHANHIQLLRDGIGGPGGTWADIGAGAGAFTLALADLIGPTGEVHAVDRDARNWPVGWWWRGLTSSPVLVRSNAKWLSFEAGRQEAATVWEIFAQKTGSEAVALRPPPRRGAPRRAC